MVKRKKKFDEVKKHTKTSPEIQSTELNKKIKSTLPEQQIN